MAALETGDQQGKEQATQEGPRVTGVFTMNHLLPGFLDHLTSLPEARTTSRNFTENFALHAAVLT